MCRSFKLCIVLIYIIFAFVIIQEIDIKCSILTFLPTSFIASSLSPHSLFSSVLGLNLQPCILGKPTMLRCTLNAFRQAPCLLKGLGVCGQNSLMVCSRIYFQILFAVSFSVSLCASIFLFSLLHFCRKFSMKNSVSFQISCQYCLIHLIESLNFRIYFSFSAEL